MLKQAFLRLPETQRQFIGFCFAGVLGFSVDNAVLSLLVRVFGVPPVTARVFSIAVAMVASWQINRNLTFRNRAPQPIWQEFLLFCLANGFGNLMSFLSFIVLVSNVDFFHRVPEAATVIGLGISLGFNFTGSKYFVFRRK